MMARRLYLTCLPLLLAAAPASAQVEDEQFWEQVNLNVPLTPDVRVTLEEIARWGDRADGISQTEFGALLGTKLAKGVEFGFGYRRVGLFSASRAAVHEDRLRQQVVLTHGPLIGRLRVDERFNPGGHEVGFRIRPLARYNYALGSRGFALFASHESFFIPNSTAWGQHAGYERMRNMAGVVVPLFSRKALLDIGYLNQYRFALAGARPQMEHALSLQLTINAIGPILHD
ncbi:DUF2490 domain-containing protein [Sphingomonas sp. KR1UV-12]|uniref:DUF2490 domain-containing protein n=1 Tax=Sphingomonas aurea TaxID=3063994 RepID=A0ABT9EIB6_9SPHN|nr:DUF2490 domain-containing protein [Sphingomonas sp. KR1UV-12]MDP1026703.1 DUF2490 domain-containing protein [Sphingomonas sp. KR1UV-12]